ncbi:hypothetical protein [Desulfobulbus oralis]|uniref:hypothetical protein n=1 Tax=Desulfobulbus oralis TaxID=1986146 RepID=UPI0015E471B9|nr:hypothetical protein [Desulfobulbus oralis]
MAQLTRKGTIATLCPLRKINLSSTGCYGYDEAAGELNTITYPSSRVPSWQP